MVVILGVLVRVLALQYYSTVPEMRCPTVILASHAASSVAACELKVRVPPTALPVVGTVSLSAVPEMLCT